MRYGFEDVSFWRKERVSGCEGHLRFRKGSDFLRGILYFGRSPLYLGGGFGGQGFLLSFR